MPAFLYCSLAYIRQILVETKLSFIACISLFLYIIPLQFSSLRFLYSSYFILSAFPSVLSFTEADFDQRSESDNFRDIRFVQEGELGRSPVESCLLRHNELSSCPRSEVQHSGHVFGLLRATFYSSVVAYFVTSHISCSVIS